MQRAPHTRRSRPILFTLIALVLLSIASVFALNLVAGLGVSARMNDDVRPSATPPKLERRIISELKKSRRPAGSWRAAWYRSVRRDSFFNLSSLYGARGETQFAAPKRDGEFEGDANRRRDWFMFRRTFPGGTIPVGARRRAFEQVKRMRTARRSFLKVGELSPVWRSIGPTQTDPYLSQIGQTSGRINSIAIAPNDDQLILVGSATGGIWRSTDGGETFFPVSDYQEGLSIAAIAFAPSNPSMVYAATGDIGSEAYFGSGVLKSEDAGRTWRKN